MQKFLKVLMIVGAFALSATSFAEDTKQPTAKTGQTDSLACPAQDATHADKGGAGGGVTAPAGGNAGTG